MFLAYHLVDQGLRNLDIGGGFNIKSTQNVISGSGIIVISICHVILLKYNYALYKYAMRFFYILVSAYLFIYLI